MKTFIRVVMSVALLLCGVAQAKLNVVTTIGDLGALAREVGGEHITVKVLAKPTQDPHFVDARPNLVVDVSNAQLLVINGLDLEVGWLGAILTSARNPAVQPGEIGHLDASTLVTPKEIPKAKLDRSMGDIHPGGNPHYLHDPWNAVAVAKGISERLARLDPEHATAYGANFERFKTALEVKIAEWRAALAPFKGASVVTYHKSWIYFVEWAGLNQVAFVEPKPGLPPSAGHVTNVALVMKTRKVAAILQEEWYPAATSEQLAKMSGAKVARLPGQTKDGQSYAAHTDELVSAVVTALSR